MDNHSIGCERWQISLLNFEGMVIWEFCLKLKKKQCMQSIYQGNGRSCLTQGNQGYPRDWTLHLAPGLLTFSEETKRVCLLPWMETLSALRFSCDYMVFQVFMGCAASESVGSKVSYRNMHSEVSELSFRTLSDIRNCGSHTQLFLPSRSRKIKRTGRGKQHIQALRRSTFY